MFSRVLRHVFKAVRVFKGVRGMFCRAPMREVVALQTRAETLVLWGESE